MDAWKLILVVYVAVGTLLILTTTARNEVFGAMSPAEARRIPFWKVVLFYGVITTAAVILWPVFLPSWFRKQTTVWDLLQQPKGKGGSGLKELFDVMNSMTEAGCDTDEIPGATGEFGWNASNPVPTRSVLGSTSYLNRLQTQDGREVFYERIGTFDSPAIEMPVDGYAIQDRNGQDLGILYISPYHQRNSLKAPSGLEIV